MNLKVIHLIRKIERINRDMEEIESMLNTLQMDREYSYKLKDSLIEEFHRLKKLKKEILKQVVFIPPHLETVLTQVHNQASFREHPKIEFYISNQGQENANSSLEEISLKNMQNNKENISVFLEEKPKKTPETRNNSSNLIKEKKITQQNIHDDSKTQSPFIFRFE